ncbi:hypothetical protein PVAP13_5KG663100 [Panicum virgatum]|uniref:Secreted protein n=1 Tax=Panicum virgatum TaxID=38727 RepID=A0A8T0T1Q6_PANVG|nr:hypothetical protein PVAP13_5KG663100 [Panicum virgatum]
MASRFSIRTTVLVVIVAEAMVLAVHGARPLGIMEELVTTREASSSSLVAKPPSLRIPALISFDQRYVEEADSPAAALYLMTDCTHKTPANGS